MHKTKADENSSSLSLQVAIQARSQPQGRGVLSEKEMTARILLGVFNYS